MGKQLANKHEIRPRLGSFWYEQIAPDQERGVLALQHILDHSSAQTTLQASGDWALGVERTVESDLALHYDPREIVQVGAAVWQIELPAGLEPVSIMTREGRLLLRGMGFYTGGGMLKLQAHPDTLFENNRILVKSAKLWRRNLLSYTMQLDGVGGSVDYVRDYYRGSQSPKNFELALAQAAGLKITPKAGFLYRKSLNDGAVMYEFDYGKITVPYAHATLDENSYYEAGVIIGDQIHVGASDISSGAPATDGYDLYELGWSGALCLNSVCPIQGVTIPDTNINYTAEAAPGGKFHLRLDTAFSAPTTDAHDNAVYDSRGVIFAGVDVASNIFTPDQPTADKFHQWLFDSENRSGLYLNDLLVSPAAAPGDTGNVPLLKLLFQHILGRRGLLIDLSTQNMSGDYHQRALKFINREKPVGSIPIIRLIDVSYDLDSQLLEDWTAVIYSNNGTTWTSECAWDDEPLWDDKLLWIDPKIWDAEGSWKDCTIWSGNTIWTE